MKHKRDVTGTLQKVPITAIVPTVLLDTATLFVPHKIEYVVRGEF
jgi:hypothetical protein